MDGNELDIDTCKADMFKIQIQAWDISEMEQGRNLTQGTNLM